MLDSEARAVPLPAGRSPDGGRAATPRRPSREALVRAALPLYVVFGTVTAFGLAGSRPPLAPFNERRQPDWLRGPLADLGLGLGELGFVCLLVVMLALYVVVVTRPSTVDARPALGAVILLHVLFMLGPPVVQTDIFGYLMYGRLGVLHDLVPYTHVANDVPYDPMRLNVGWKHFPSPYGPLFTLFTYVLAPLPVVVAIGVLKVGTAAASLGAVALTWSCARRLERPALPAALFVGLNPLLLIWGVGAAHNDLFMLVLVLAGVRLALADREALAGVAAVAAGAVKTTSALVLPFMLIGVRRERRLLVGALIATAVLGVASLVTFGVDGVRGMVATVLAQGRLVSGHSVPNDLFRAFGAERLPPGLRPIFPVIFAVVLALLLRRTWRGSDWVTNAGWATLALLLTLTFLMPWYVVWLLPLAALADTDRLRWATLAVTAFLVAGRGIVLLT